MISDEEWISDKKFQSENSQFESNAENEIGLLGMAKNEFSRSSNMRDNQSGSESNKKDKSVSNNNGFPHWDTKHSNDAFESMISQLPTQKDYVEFECLPDSFKFLLKYRLSCEMHFLNGYQSRRSNPSFINNNWLPLNKFPKISPLTSFNSIENNQKQGVMSYDNKNKLYFIKNSTISQIWKLENNQGDLNQILERLMEYILENNLIDRDYISFENNKPLQIAFGKKEVTQEEFMNLLVDNFLEEASNKFNTNS